MVGELFRVAAEYGSWGVAALLSLLAARSRPGRAIGRVIETEIRWRYLRAKGVSEKKLRKLLLDDFGRDDPPELPPPETGEPKPPDPVDPKQSA